MSPELHRPTRPRDIRFAQAIARFDAANAADPRVVAGETGNQPAELFYAQQVTSWVLRLAPSAPEPLLLASRCQHLRRWEIPRSRYPAGLNGYLAWREDLKHFHADTAEKILREVGYDDPVIAKVRSLNLKETWPEDPDARVLEDALCLVFLQCQLPEMAGKTEPAKIVDILRKTRDKMTPDARACAAALPFPEAVRPALAEAGFL